MIKHRKELDGLRCIAVMAVIVYHSGISVFGHKILKGGFFGVDVFFVLSGYLITDIILNKLNANSFSLAEFFWRRAKRIFPALSIMVAVTSLFAYYFLLPNYLVNFSQSLKSVLYFGSNYFFLGEDSYVSESSLLKPLLHTWSLSVEWQFYILYPFLLIAINRVARNYTVHILLLLLIASLLYAHHIVPDYPNVAFYTLQSRAWELVAGGLITFFSAEKTLKVGRNIAARALPSLGMVMVICAMIFIDSNVSHPSFITIIPVAGTCIVIAFANKNDYMTKMLSLSPFVFVGAISYSLYLWHQPVFVFFRFSNYGEVNLINFTLLTALTFVFAYLSYRFIECPLRKVGAGKYGYFPIAGAVFASLFFSASAISNGGYLSRYSNDFVKSYEMYKIPEFRKMIDTEHPGVSLRTDDNVTSCGFRSLEAPCRYGNEEWITIGDSYAGQYDNELLKHVTSQGEGMVSLTYEQCPFVSNIWFGNVPECLVINKQRWKFIEGLKHKKKIIVTTNYNFFWQGKAPVPEPIEMGKKDFSGGVGVDERKVWESYAENIKKLVQLGHEVYVIYPVPVPSEDVQSLVLSMLRNSSYKLTKEYTSSLNAYPKALEESAKLDHYLPDMPGLYKIRPVDTLCEGNKCRIIDVNGGLYHGAGHLSANGVREIINLIDRTQNSL